MRIEWRLRFAINFIAWPFLIPNVVAHRKPRWWRSNSLIRLWFLYFPHWGGLYIRNVCGNRQFWHFSKLISWIVYLIFYYQVSRITNDFSVYLCGFFIQFITSVQRYTYLRFLMKNLIRSKVGKTSKTRSWNCKEKSRKSFTWVVLLTNTQRFYKQQPTRSVICGPAIHAQIQFVNEAVLQQHDSHFHSEKWDSLEQRCSTIFINNIFC